MFRAIISYCILSNSTINDALATLLNTYLITTETLSRQDFNEQTQVLISNFLSNVKQTFKYMSVLAHETTRGNQLLSSRVSNFFLDGIFDSNQNLIRVQTHLGTMSSIDDMLPTCSCALSMCSQLLGFFNRSSNGSIFTLITEIPGMYSACYPLDGLRKSTLECWFNDTCIEIISSNLTPFPVDISFNPLNASQLIRFSPKSTLGDIIDEIMVEEWRQTISYEAYYRSCKPLKCVFTYTHRLDLIYVVTTLAAVFGGLSVSFQIVCSWLIKFYVHRRRTNTVSTSTTATVTALQSTPPVPIIPLCSINATWKREAVTVAGFSNSTSDSSLSGLYYPEDIVVDAMGNLYIQDFLNRRILYWPTNSTEGRSIAGTGVSGEEPNQLRSPDGLLGDDQF
ncbi:unnamed protein product [Rotaria socialis]|nr:unnamed protein product [Rotaria socialis]